MKQTILVTGGTGFIGSHTTVELQEAGYEVVIIDNLSNSTSESLCDLYDNPNFTFYEFDVMKYVPKILNNIAVDFGNKITESVPLGHLGNYESMFSPQRVDSTFVKLTLLHVQS